MNDRSYRTSALWGRGMLVKGVLTVFLVLAAVAAYAEEASSVHDPALPETLERLTAPKAIAYVFFFVLAGLAVLVVFRGIRTR